MYVTLKLDANQCCRIHSVSDDGNGWIVTDERYVVMPWKMVTRHGKTMGPHTTGWGEASGPGPHGAMTLQRQLIVYLVKKNPRLKSAKEERERERRN